MNLFSTFASMRKTVASLSLVTLIAGMFATGVATAATSKVFNDVPVDSWFASYVSDLADAGVIDTTVDNYRPVDSVNRAEMAKYAFFVSGLPLETATVAPFSDVAMGQWYTNYIYTLSKNGIVSGDKDKAGLPTGKFRPSAALNRAEATKMLVNAAQMAEDLSGAPHFPSDVKSSDWFFNFVETAFNNGVVAGYPDGSFGPAKNINRAEAAKMVSLSMNPVSAGFTLDSAASASLTTVELIFSMNVDKATSETMANYKVEDSTGVPLAVTGVSMTAADTVMLTVASQTKGKVYYVTAKNVKSAAGDDLANTDSVSFLGYGADVSGGNLTVSLSSATPKAGSVPQGATGVKATCWDFTGGATASTVKSLTVKRVGPGVETAFDNVYLYNGDARITTGRSINNSTQATEFSNINQTIGAGQTVQICLVADLALTGSAGGVHAFELSDAAAVMSNSSSMTGSFPLRGSDMLISTASVGKSVVKKNGSLDEVTIGTAGARIAQFEIAAGSTEDQMLNRIALYVRGRATSGALTNLKLFVEGDASAVASATSVGAKDLATFVLASPYKIGKGQTKIFYVTADITGARNGDDIKVYVDENTDVFVKGSTFGYGTQIDITAYDGDDADAIPGTADDQYSYVLLKGSKFTVAFNGPVASDIAVNQKQAKCMTMTITNAAGLPVTIKDWVVNLTAVGGDGLLNAVAPASANFTQIQLSRLNDDGSIGGVLLGSSELLIPAGNDLTQDVTLKGTASLASGESVKAAITFDVANNAALAGQTIKCSLLPPTGSDQVKDSNNDSLGATNITPSSTIGGNTMSLVTAALTFTKNSSPTNFTQIAKGTSGVTLLAVQAKAGSALDTVVKSLTVKGDTVSTVGSIAATTNAAGVITPGVIVGGFGYVTGQPVTATYTGCTVQPTGSATLLAVNGVITGLATNTFAGGTTCASVVLSFAASTLDINNVVDSIGVYNEAGTLVSDLKSFPASAVSSNSATVTFNNLNIPVAKNGTVNLFVKGMVSNSLPSAEVAHFSIFGTPLVIDSVGQTVTGVVTTAIDGTVALTKELVLVLGSSPTVSGLISGANDPKLFAEAVAAPTMAFTLKSTNGNSTLQDLTVNLSTTGAVNPIDKVALYSATSAGVCDTGTTLLKDFESVVGSGPFSVSFTNINKTLTDSQNTYFCVVLKSKVVATTPVSLTDITTVNVTFDKIQDQSGAAVSPMPAPIAGPAAKSYFFKGYPTFTPVTLPTGLSNGTEIDVMKVTAGSVGSVDTLKQFVISFNSLLAPSLPTSCNMYRGAGGGTKINTANVPPLGGGADANKFAFVPANWTNGLNTPWTNGQEYTVRCTFAAVVAGTSTQAKIASIATGSLQSAVIWDDSNFAPITDDSNATGFGLVDNVLLLNSVNGPVLNSII